MLFARAAVGLRVLALGLTRRVLTAATTLMLVVFLVLAARTTARFILFGSSENALGLGIAARGAVLMSFGLGHVPILRFRIHCHCLLSLVHLGVRLAIFIRVHVTRHVLLTICTLLTVEQGYRLIWLFNKVLDQF